jgi:glyoxylase-like metal-dependent hydrolase (beta-lactamase superfamily II)
LFFRQTKYQGDNFSYLIADDGTREAAVVDPGYNSEVIIDIIRSQKLHLKYVINTHHHLDHIGDNGVLKKIFGSKVVAHKLSQVEKDVEVDDGDIITVGTLSIRVIHTPGHTPDSICLLVGDKLLTGDTLFVGECGRTDLPGGSSKELYSSLFDKLAKLDDNIEVYPGHDYGPRPNSTIGTEKITNYVLKKRSLQEFIEFMRQ